MSIVDELLAHPGVYIGIDEDTQGRGQAAAKIIVTPLPGGSGVALDYETFNAGNPDRVRGHAEHAILGRTHGGGAILISAHVHAGTVAVLRESEPGVFVLGTEPSAFPMAIRIAMPEPGRLIHAWSYGAPGEEAVERDVAELTLQT
jgi:hypothetical protein